ncbi:MAG: hypothetical protein OXF52_00370 [Candidatus Dadabacteria bacterium]|nr:hypothetical protein [Candidatus Dadabacteria bacterium]
MKSAPRKGSIFNEVYQYMKFALPKYPQGCRAEDLKKEMFETFGGKFLKHTIGSSMSKVVDKYSDEFQKRKIEGKKGVWYFSNNSQEVSITTERKIPEQENKLQRKEEDFYKPFADYLMSSRDGGFPECTKAIPLGGNTFRDFWATPDVIGLYEKKRSDVIPFSPEVVSAEIKLENSKQALMTAFGQACSYRLFSHKTYLVVPNVDVVRLKTLCRGLGIGLVLFDPKSEKIDSSIFETELLAQKHEPNMSYVNNYLKQIAGKL